jgi:diaminopimelate decarboxylase
MNPIDFSLLPSTARVNAQGTLEIGGTDLIGLAREYGTPLFVYDEQELVDQFVLAHKLFGSGVAYATKAFLNKSVASLANSCGLSLDVSTEGEYQCCRRAGVPASRLVVHGNNKTRVEVETAVREDVQWIVADSFDDLRLISSVAKELGRRPNVLVRINPGVEVYTHKYVATGNRESKFGFPTWTSDGEQAVDMVKADPNLIFKGLHMHVGSFVLSTETFTAALKSVVEFTREVGPEVLVVGGGLGVRYLETDTCPSLEEWSQAILEWCKRYGISARILAEPGRALVARAAVTLYTVGGVAAKGERTFVSVDGGMSDNPRPLLYGSGYELFDVSKVRETRTMQVDLVGRHCESGDTLVRGGLLPESTRVGDVVCTPVTGAYGYSMASNYNLMPRPAVVFVRDGQARVVARRESIDDLLSLDMG